jgi:hypothetical protein
VKPAPSDPRWLAGCLGFAAIVAYAIVAAAVIASAYTRDHQDLPDVCANPYPAVPGEPCKRGTDLLLIGGSVLVCGCPTIELPDMTVQPELEPDWEIPKELDTL